MTACLQGQRHVAHRRQGIRLPLGSLYILHAGLLDCGAAWALPIADVSLFWKAAFQALRPSCTATGTQTLASNVYDLAGCCLPPEIPEMTGCGSQGGSGLPFP